MKNFIQHHAWKIIEDQFDPTVHQISESLFSLGNGYMGQRGNFEEHYSGRSLQGQYLAGIYYPDKTRVGWWKNGYPKYFAKVLNAPSWIDLSVVINGIELDLHSWKILSFVRTLDMKSGILSRKVEVSHDSGLTLEIISRRVCHYKYKELGLLEYSIKILEGEADILFKSFLDGDVRNEDANYDEQFWHDFQIEIGLSQLENYHFLACSTKKTNFKVQYVTNQQLYKNHLKVKYDNQVSHSKSTEQIWRLTATSSDLVTLKKSVCIVSSFYHPADQLREEAKNKIQSFLALDWKKLWNIHKESWAEKWLESDIVINGDVAAQQGIRFNIFHLHQTYRGDDPRLNIGPKGFTGEKYGGSTYWDTEAYCLPFYLSTAEPSVSRNLLLYRFKHLQKAIQNAQLLGFENGAALYPMVTMNGEECHNEWEITFEEIHRNGAIAYAIYDYVRYTGDTVYLYKEGIEVLVAISRFWAQRVHYASPKKKYVMHGVTGPNEYENNVNNNWYTNYVAIWCLRYTLQTISEIELKDPDLHKDLQERHNVTFEEQDKWRTIIENLYLPKDDQKNIFIQHEGYLDKEIRPVSTLSSGERPINQHWSWDRILRSCFIKQADVLQGLYFFEDHFDHKTIKDNFDFYEPLTVHESSLSPCVHAILACTIKAYEKSYEMYLRTARLDLDDYNNDTEDGCHITSMAGTWMAVIKGFAGMRIVDNHLSFRPHCPKKWTSYVFHLKFRGREIDVEINKNEIKLFNHGTAMNIMINGRIHLAQANVWLHVNYSEL